MPEFYTIFARKKSVTFAKFCQYIDSFVRVLSDMSLCDYTRNITPKSLSVSNVGLISANCAVLSRYWIGLIRRAAVSSCTRTPCHVKPLYQPSVRLYFCNNVYFTLRKALMCFAYLHFTQYDYSFRVSSDVKFHVIFWREIFHEIFREIFLKYFKNFTMDHGRRLYSSLQQQVNQLKVSICCYAWIPLCISY